MKITKAKKTYHVVSWRNSLYVFQEKARMKGHIFKPVMDISQKQAHNDLCRIYENILSVLGVL